MWRKFTRAALFCCLVVVTSSLSPVMLRSAIAGGDGKGGGKGFMPHVGPLARKGYIETLPDDYLADVIAEGGAAAGKSAFMPSWKNTLTPQDIADVVAFIRTLVVE